uniref:Uncharacterized protein n=1 Tax=Candidatus Kentrum sp. LPFa TaxID=2126335 RepID=A0A450WNQ5_9GAMM|nr:MAG: hypothetical protein BECKLPF1236B_GA0070989_11478 [Candidatus Kentron sp. LPFa]
MDGTLIAKKYLLLAAYQGNDGRVVDENLWFRLGRVGQWNFGSGLAGLGIGKTKFLGELARMPKPIPFTLGAKR